MNSIIKIFKAEKNDGVAEKVRACSSIAYVTQLEALDPHSKFGKNLVKTFASSDHPSETLYPMKDILVTTGINLNWDVFIPDETYTARNTSLHHPLNFEHDEKRIIGCITSCQAVDEAMNPIKDDLAVEELPSKFHILNGSVIYRTWNDEALQKLIDLTIAEIERGEWFVSMECVFRGFDYAVTRPDGVSAIITRDDNSSFLTKHLRQYGGDGIYRDPTSKQEFEIGRILRNISFSGKGLVRKPANPESVILNHVSAFVASSASLEYIKAEEEIIPNPSVDKTERKDMSETNLELKNLQDKVNELTRQNETLAFQLKDNDSKVAQATIETLKDEVKQKDVKIVSLQDAVSGLNQKVDVLTKRVDAAEAEKVELAESLANITADKIEKERVALLLGKGASAEKANEYAKKFSRFTDEEFADFAETVSAAWKQVVNKAENVIANVKVDKEISMAVANESSEDQSEQRIAVASEFLSKYLKINKLTQTK